ncbi:hypothetical protein CN918_32470 [Priestia megaterium]|nr:hypothetical protein CN918_32470 [Priestia megaterium]
MIYKDVLDFLLSQASSTEIDTILYALPRIDWDGFLRVSIEELAMAVGSTKKYMRSIMEKLSNPMKGKLVFTLVETSEGPLYRFNLGKPGYLKFDKNVDRYSKKYNFFYTEGFRNLSLNGKRLILMGAFRMSVAQDEIISIATNKIVPNVHNQVSLPFTQKRLEAAVNEINASEMSTYVCVSFGYHIVGREKSLTFIFKPGTLSQYKENMGEALFLQQTLYRAGYKRLLSSEHMAELLGTSKYLYEYALSAEKMQARLNKPVVGAKDELLKSVRHIYKLSVQKLAVQLHNPKVREFAPKALSAYFSDIIFDTVLNEAGACEHQAVSLKKLLDREQFHKDICDQQSNEPVGFIEVHNKLSPLRDKYALISRIAQVLKQWCVKWVKARFSNATNRFESKDETTTYINKILATTKERIEKMFEKMKTFANKVVRDTLPYEFSVEMEKSLTDYLDMHKNRAG